VGLKLELREELQIEKADQIVEDLKRRREAKEIAEYLRELRENYVLLEKERNALKNERVSVEREISQLSLYAVNVEKRAVKIRALQNKAVELRVIWRNLRFLSFKQKSDTAKEIARVEQEIQRLCDAFKHNYNINPEQAKEEMRRTCEKIRAKELEIGAKDGGILEVTKKLKAVELEYHTQKLLAEARSDKGLIAVMSRRVPHPREMVRERLLYERVDRRLNFLAEENFQKVLEHANPDQIRTLSDIWRKIKDKEREKAKEKSHTYELTR
jgi:hypothetical protein